MPTTPKKKIRYAVVGLGYFAQEAVLPAFAHAKDNSELTAFVSGDPKKHQKLGAKYGVKDHYTYEQYDECLKSGRVDAVYIVLPNTLHKEYTVRAAHAGIHVLCEKPMATTEKDCQAMIAACEANNVRLMIAYRLHLEAATLDLIEQVKKGKIGDLRYFSSCFSHHTQKGNIRNRAEVGGGGLWDIGVYCINASRYVLRAEPTSVFAITANTDPKRFEGVDEVAAAILRFPGERFAQFTCSQNAGEVSEFRVVGTKGDIHMQPAYDYTEGLAYTLTADGKPQKQKFPKRDQVAAEIVYFSDCVLRTKNPEPSGKEGLADVRIIEALYRSAKIGRPVPLTPLDKARRPEKSQTVNRPPVDEQDLINAKPPSEG
jgi:predicted dehydrogenase